MAHQYSRVGFNSSVEVNEVNLSSSYGGVGGFLESQDLFIAHFTTFACTFFTIIFF